MTALQLRFMNGEETPLYEAVSDDELPLSLERVNIDTSQEIRYVSMKVHAFQYYGIRFYDETQKKIVSKTFWNDKLSYWTSLQEVPSD